MPPKSISNTQNLDQPLFQYVWSLANGQESRLKAQSKNGFSQILLDKKKVQDGCSIGGSKGAKVGEAFSKDVPWIIYFYRRNFCFSESVGVCADNYIRKSGHNLGTNTANADGDGGADNPGTADVDGVQEPGISIADINENGGAKNLGTSIANSDGPKDLDTSTVDRNKAKNPDIGMPNTDGDRKADNRDPAIVDVDGDGGVDNPGTDTTNANGMKNLGIM